jgi:adenylylsulfate kinase
MAAEQKTLAVDFDGVIASYDVWKGKGNFGEPIDGVHKYIQKLRNLGWRIVIHTTRLETHQVKEYLDRHGIQYDYINHNPENIEQQAHPCKPLATVYLDDRGLTFNGDWERAFNNIIDFEVWYRKEMGTGI